MENKTWITFAQGNASYMLKKQIVDNYILIFLTDLKKVWSERLPQEELHQRFTDLNKSFDLSSEESQKEVFALIESVGENVEAEIEKHADTSLLRLNGKVLDFSVTYEFTLQLCDQEVFFTEITLPLLKTVKCLEQQQDNLTSLLVQKDREISEYMLEKGDTITKKYLITEQFDRAQIDSGKRDVLFGVRGASELFWKNIYGEDEIPEQSTKKLKTSPTTSHAKQRVKVYSSRTKKNPSQGIKYKA